MWYDLSMAIFFTSDQHFQHANILKFGRGNGRFSSINEHDAYIQQKWWETVTPDDTVYVLGDAAMGNIEVSIQKFASLPGDKLFIPGNHDHIFSGMSKNHVARHLPLYEAVGFTILPETLTLDIPTSTGHTEVLLSHFPYAATQYEKAEKFAKNRPVFNHQPLIHGHTHSTARFNPDNPYEFHVGVDANDFTPVNITEISAWLDNLPSLDKKKRH
jgi:calcineurin-like phosphoesterase family protein